MADREDGPRVEGRRLSVSLVSLRFKTFVQLCRKTTVRGRSSRVSASEATPDEALSFWEELRTSGRFSRDSGRGGALHKGQVSLREISDRDSLHVSVGENNRISVHIDKFSPLARNHSGWVARYSPARVLAHVTYDVVTCVVQRMTGRRDQHRLELECRDVEVTEAGADVIGEHQAGALERRAVECREPDSAPPASPTGL